MLKKKIWANSQRIKEFFTQKMVTYLSKYGFGIRDPGSGINLFRIPGLKRHWIPDPDPQTVSIMKTCDWIRIWIQASLNPLTKI
jgi:hypothetical protein